MTIERPPISPATRMAGDGTWLAQRQPLPKIIWPLAVLAVCVLFNVVVIRNFAHVEVLQGRISGMLIDIPKNASPVMLVAVGMALVLATGGVDLSVGAVMAIAGALAALMLDARWPLPVVFAAALLASVAAGAWNGLLVAGAKLQPIVATLILMVAGRGIAQLPSSGNKIPIVTPWFDYLGRGHLLGIPFCIWFAVGIAALTVILARRTAAGLFVESVGNNAEASYYAGVNAAFVKLSVYAYCGLCAGLAGLVRTSNTMESDPGNTGLYVELDAILAAVIGGTALSGGRFSIVGAIIGALIMETITTTIYTWGQPTALVQGVFTRIFGYVPGFLRRGIPSEANLVVKSAVVLLVCMLQSDALRGWLSRRLRRRAL